MRDRNLSKLERYSGVVERSLFRLGNTLSYERTIDAIIKLSKCVKEASEEHKDKIFNSDSYSIEQFLVGAYHFFCDYHGGQFSKEYEALSCISFVYNPGMSGIDQDSLEYHVYEQLEKKLKGE